jgi:hypothetical protein
LHLVNQIGCAFLSRRKKRKSHFGNEQFRTKFGRLLVIQLRGVEGICHNTHHSVHHCIYHSFHHAGRHSFHHTVRHGAPTTASKRLVFTPGKNHCDIRRRAATGRTILRTVSLESFYLRLLIAVLPNGALDGLNQARDFFRGVISSAEVACMFLDKKNGALLRPRLAFLKAGI